MVVMESHSMSAVMKSISNRISLRRRSHPPARLSSTGTVPSQDNQHKVDVDDIKKQIQRAIDKPKYTVFDLYKKTGLYQEIARHQVFENITLMVITANALWMAVDTDWNQETNLLNSAPVFQCGEHLFCFYFFLEWFIRFMSFRRKSDGRKDAWFVFDTALVLMMVGETWGLTLFFVVTDTSGSGGGVGVLRLIRLLRLSRMVRMLRSAPDLLILVKGMASSTKSVCYVMCLLLCFMYVFAIACKQIADGTEVGDEYFPGVPGSMKTLFLSGVLMDNLSEIAQAMKEQSRLLLVAFFAFVLLGNLTVMNMLIGVLCEVVSNVAKYEKEQICVSFVTEKLKFILESLDDDSNFCISKDEFRNILQQGPAVQALSDVGVDPIGVVDYADYIFDELTESSPDKEISFEDFMQMILHLRTTNSATVKDCVDLRKFMKQRIEVMDESMSEELAELRAGMVQNTSRPSSRLSDMCCFDDSYSSPDSSPNQDFSLHVAPMMSSEEEFTLRAALASQRRRSDRLAGNMQSLLADVRSLRRRITDGGGPQDVVTEYSKGGGIVSQTLRLSDPALDCGTPSACSTSQPPAASRGSAAIM